MGPADRRQSVCAVSTSPLKANQAFSFANGSNQEGQSIRSGHLFKEINNQVINSEVNADGTTVNGTLEGSCDEAPQVLIVDDDMFNLQILNDLIRMQLQVTASQACSGQIAVDIVKQKIKKIRQNRGLAAEVGRGGTSLVDTLD